MQHAKAAETHKRNAGWWRCSRQRWRWLSLGCVSLLLLRCLLLHPNASVFRGACLEIHDDHVEALYARQTACITQAQRQQILTRLLRVLTTILQEQDVDYWLDSGSLLGQFRTQSVIPWDTDADIGLTEQALEHLRVTSVEIPNGYVLHVLNSPIHAAGDRDLNIPARFIDTKYGFYVDLFVFQETLVNGIMMLSTTASSSWNLCVKCVRVGKFEAFFVIPKRYVFPLLSCPFEEFHVLCPAQRTKYLDHIYGPTFRIPTPA